MRCFESTSADCLGPMEKVSHIHSNPSPRRCMARSWEKRACEFLKVITQKRTPVLNIENLSSRRRTNRPSREECARPLDTVKLGRARRLRWNVVDGSERCCYSALTIGGLTVASTELSSNERHTETKYELNAPSAQTVLVSVIIKTHD